MSLTPHPKDLAMSHGLDPAFDDETVYRRTDKGRAALLGQPAVLPPSALALLARVNGFTGLGTLLDQQGRGEPQVAEVVGLLLSHGLIEAVAPLPSGLAGHRHRASEIAA
jgi:hypothetical protein